MKVDLIITSLTPSFSKVTFWTWGLLLGLSMALVAESTQPNVIIVITDDQGYGDVGANGHPFLRTPNMDQLIKESVYFTDFHVAPVCTPTRSQLLTGVDAMKNGATMPALGRSMLRRDIPTLANYFGDAGYKTILSGKWHLGDSYPYRPEDRGFQELLSFRAWGPPSMACHWDNSYANEDIDVDSYTNPTLLVNGNYKKHEGYVTDIIFDHAMEQMRVCKAKKEPFFLYLATPTPHRPNFAPEKNSRFYSEMAEKGYEKQIDVPYYGMIENLDDNMGRLEAFLAEQELKDNTIVIFLSDNGTQSTLAMNLYNAGMSGKKGAVHEGGHRVPMTLRWKKGNLKRGSKIDELTQVQDLCPTLLNLCGITPKNLYPQDGKDLTPLLKGKAWPHANRTLVIDLGGGRNHCVLKGPWRLVNDSLYNLDHDLQQNTDVSKQHPEIKEQLSEYYRQWRKVAMAEFKKKRYIDLGHPLALTTMLNSCDWAGKGVDNPKHLISKREFGLWHVDVIKSGTYRFELSRWPFESGKALTEAVYTREPIHDHLNVKNWAEAGKIPIASATLSVWKNRNERLEKTVKAQPQDTHVTFDMQLPKGPQRVSAVFHDANDKDLCGAYFVRVTFLD